MSMQGPAARRGEADETTMLVYDLVNPLHPLSEEPVSVELTAALCRLLGGADPAAPLAERLAWVEQAWAWVTAAPGGERLRFLLRVLELYPQLRRSAGGVVVSVLRDVDSLSLFAEAGLPAEPGVFSEAAARLARGLLPRARRERELADLLERLFPTEAEVRWLEALPPALVERAAAALEGLLLPEGPAVRALRQSLAESVAILGLRASARGLAPDARALLAAPGAPGAPFVRLASACEAVAAAHRTDPDDRAGLAEAARAARLVVAECLNEVQRLLARGGAERAGLGLLYGLELIRRRLERAALLLATLAGPGAGPLAARRLAARLGRDTRAARRVAGLVSPESVRRLGAAFADHLGRSGEHYITRTADELHQLFTAGVGGGLLTALTTALKVAIGAAALPLFPEGALVAANYAGSFLAMQLLGFSLATKQTPFTSAALAGAVKGGPDPAKAERLVARVLRSQLVAVVANVAAVVPAAVALDLLWRMCAGHSYMTAAEAHRAAQALHPLQSGTLIDGVITGVFLWLSGAAGGAFENWARYHRLPEALAASGPGLGGRLLRALNRNLAGSATCVVLGALMGLFPALCHFLGLPLEVRHVTLASGQLALAGAALGPLHLLDAGFLPAVAGIACTALTNLAVSFSLGLAVSLHAHEVEHFSVRAFARSMLAGLRNRPHAFLVAPRAEAAAEPGQH